MLNPAAWGLGGDFFERNICYDPGTLTALATVAQVAGTAVSAMGTIAAGKQAEASGKAAQQAAEFEAKQLDISAKEEQAKKQQEAFALRRNKKLALSKLQTVGAGSGFSATDPSTLAIADEIERYGTLQEQTAFYGGEMARRDLELAAAGKRFEGAQALAEGKAAKRGSYFSAAGTILGGASTMADRYSRRRPASAGRYG